MNPFENGWDEAAVESVLARGKPEELLYVPIVISLQPPDCAWAQEICIRLAAHEDAHVRANALLGLGHLSRTCGALDETRVRPLIEAGLLDEDERVRGNAETAASDIRFFLGWEIGEAYAPDEEEA